LRLYADCVYFVVKAVFVELPAFERHRESYLDDPAFARLQDVLMGNPLAGDMIPSAGGLRKLRFRDERRGKGSRGGLRVIYYYWNGGPEFWLFAVYDKDEAEDLTSAQRAMLSQKVKQEIEKRALK